jgi:hypothetical protein
MFKLIQPRHYFPESVSRICVVFIFPQRFLSRHRAQDQNCCTYISDGRESFFHVLDLLNITGRGMSCTPLDTVDGSVHPACQWGRSAAKPPPNGAVSDSIPMIGGARATPQKGWRITRPDSTDARRASERRDLHRLVPLLIEVSCRSPLKLLPPRRERSVLRRIQPRGFRVG